MDNKCVDFSNWRLSYCALHASPDRPRRPKVRRRRHSCRARVRPTHYDVTIEPERSGAHVPRRRRDRARGARAGREHHAQRGGLEVRIGALHGQPGQVRGRRSEGHDGRGGADGDLRSRQVDPSGQVLARARLHRQDRHAGDGAVRNRLRHRCRPQARAVHAVRSAGCASHDSVLG